jgi:chromosome segregation ATPase
MTRNYDFWLLPTVFTLAVCLVISGRPAADAQKQSANQPGSLPKQQTQTLLASFSDIVDWAKEITPKLRAQGNQADRDKLSSKLAALSQELAKTETQNLDIIKTLKAASLDYGKLNDQLQALQNSLTSISRNIGSIRSTLHLQGQTEFERHASDAVASKGLGVQTMLDKLQYSTPRNAQERAALQKEGDNLETLIRQAEDAIEAADRALQPANQ